MSYNFDKLNTVNIWNINHKVWDDNAAIIFAHCYWLLRQTTNCAIHGTAYVMNNSVIIISMCDIVENTIAVQKFVLEKEAFFKNHTSLSLQLFDFFTVEHSICLIILIIIVRWNSQIKQ